MVILSFYSKAEESVIDKLEKENVTIYENFYKEENVVRHNNIKNDEDSQSTLRFYVNREEVDKVDLMEAVCQKTLMRLQ